MGEAPRLVIYWTDRMYLNLMGFRRRKKKIGGK